MAFIITLACARVCEERGRERPRLESVGQARRSYWMWGAWLTNQTDHSNREHDWLVPASKLTMPSETSLIRPSIISSRLSSPSFFLFSSVFLPSTFFIFLSASPQPTKRCEHHFLAVQVLGASQSLTLLVINLAFWLFRARQSHDAPNSSILSLLFPRTQQ